MTEPESQEAVKPPDGPVTTPKKPTQTPVYPAPVPRPPAGLTAQEVADVFKREGHFDRLRKQLVQDFLDSRSSDDFYDRLDDLVHCYLDRLVHRARNAHPPRAPWTSTQQAYEDALRDMARHPLAERTLGDVDRRLIPRYLDGLDDVLRQIIDSKRKAIASMLVSKEQVDAAAKAPVVANGTSASA